MMRLCQRNGGSMYRCRNQLLCSARITRSLSSSLSPLETLYGQYKKEIEALPEYRAQQMVQDFLAHKVAPRSTDIFDPRRILPPTPPVDGYKHVMSKEQMKQALIAAMATFSLHVESRQASLVGKGFYTIGPCGEEMLSSAGHVLLPEDAAALHYRHLGINMCRQLASNANSANPVDETEFLSKLLLDRARGYTISRHDPVTGGVHCSIGSAYDPVHQKQGAGDFLVTSTLASQCPPAVGRALGFALAEQLLGPVLESASRDGMKKRKRRPVSFVTVGDGSVHNAHFLSALHLARHARHKRRVKCPVLLGISDNGLSISYSTGGYVDTMFQNDPLVPLYRVNGNDMMDVYSQMMAATKYVRQQSAPAVILFKELVRRFGHAATDRQGAYLDPNQIQTMADLDTLESAMVQAVEICNVLTYAELKDLFDNIQALTRQAFVTASQEEKVTRQDMLDRVSQPLVPVPRLTPSQQVVTSVSKTSSSDGSSGSTSTSSGKKEVMRKHMTRVIHEVLEEDPSVVYLGEDVEHGGYYLVTEGLVQKFPTRVMDFPPDETTLLGASMGFSQVGLTPIVELPYAKYLDCGADMFYEIAIMNWLSNAQRPNGMIIRLQGFDRGLFGGNFHTHNMISHIPPGIDVVCYSNGEDYVRGFRNLVQQAKAGRVVMSIDSTALLNLRHLHDKDRGWERVYPTKQGGDVDNTTTGDELPPIMGFDDVRRYGTTGKLAIVTYGNGVVTALQARKALVEQSVIFSEDEVDVIDSPYLSGVPQGLKDVLGQHQYSAVVFADICKAGPGSNILSSTVTSLASESLLPEHWELVCAPRTYNPLGNIATFLNVEDVMAGCQKLLEKGQATPTTVHMNGVVEQQVANEIHSNFRRKKHL